MKQETPVRKSAHAEKITSKYAHADEASYALHFKRLGRLSRLGGIFANRPEFTLSLMPWNVELEEFPELCPVERPPQAGMFLCVCSSAPSHRPAPGM